MSGYKIKWDKVMGSGIPVTLWVFHRVGKYSQSKDRVCMFSAGLTGEWLLFAGTQVSSSTSVKAKH